MPENSRVTKWREEFKKAELPAVKRKLKGGFIKTTPKVRCAETWIEEQEEKIKRADEDREEKRRREEEERADERRQEEREEEKKQREEEIEREERIEREKIQIGKRSLYVSIIAVIIAVVVAVVSWFIPRTDSELEERVNRLESRVDSLEVKPVESPSSVP